MTDMNWRQRAALKILFFMLRMLNPTGYEHQIKDLQRDILEDREASND